jgi:hypothetical protein
MRRFRRFCLAAVALACAACFCSPANAQLERRITTHILQSADDAGLAVGISMVTANWMLSPSRKRFKFSLAMAMGPSGRRSTTLWG